MGCLGSWIGVVGPISLLSSIFQEGLVGEVRFGKFFENGEVTSQLGI